MGCLFGLITGFKPHLAKHEYYMEKNYVCGIEKTIIYGMVIAAHMVLLDLNLTLVSITLAYFC